MGSANVKQNSDPHREKKPKQRRKKRRVQDAVNGDRSLEDQQTSSKRDSQDSTVSVESDLSSPVNLQSPLSKPVLIKFSPSFLATNAGLDPQINNTKLPVSEPGKRWYDHNYKRN